MSALSIYTILANVIHFQYDIPIHSYLAIIAGGTGLIWFALSIFMKQSFWAIGQLVLMFVVSVLSITINTDAFQIVVGVVFLFVTIALSWAYDLFDKKPYIMISVYIITILITSSALLGSMISGAAVTFGIVVASAILWGILYSKIKRLIDLAKRAMDLVERAKPEVDK